jgi:hypothetical protein
MMPKGPCKLEGCEKAAVGKEYCSSHYKQWRRGGLPKARYKICTAEACRKPRSLGSKCEEHGRKAAAGAAEVAAS